MKWITRLPEPGHPSKVMVLPAGLLDCQDWRTRMDNARKRRIGRLWRLGPWGLGVGPSIPSGSAKCWCLTTSTTPFLPLGSSQLHVGAELWRAAQSRPTTESRWIANFANLPEGRRVRRSDTKGDHRPKWGPRRLGLPSVPRKKRDDTNDT